MVTVPVLSSTTVSTSRVDSSTSGPLISRPSCAPRPVPTISAVGVARPSAHGQAMIRTATAAVNADAALPPVASQTARVASESAITTGTNTADTRSARRWTCALPVWASVDQAGDLCERGVGADPGRAHHQPPAGVHGRAGELEPGLTSTGIDSPVSMLMSIADVPSSTTPSVATFSPGRTTKRSPG